MPRGRGSEVEQDELLDYANYKPHVSGIYGVKVEPLERLKTLVWMREVLRRSQCDPSLFPMVYELSRPLVLSNEQKSSLTEEQQRELQQEHRDEVIERAKKLIKSLPMLGKHKKSIPVSAEFPLYVTGLREPSENTLLELNNATPTASPHGQPFLGTKDLFDNGPQRYGLWAVLKGELPVCRQLIGDELLHMGRRLFKQNDFRWGLNHSVQIHFYYKTLISDPVIKTLDSVEKVHALGEADRKYHDMAKAVLNGEIENPVLKVFKDAMADEEDPELAADTWVLHFVIIMAFWQRSILNGPSNLGLATILATGVLAGPLEKVFGIDGHDIRDFAIGMVVKSSKSLGTDETPSARYLRLKNYLEPYLSQ